MEGKSQNKFSVGDSVVYPAHGVGTVTKEEVQVIAGVEMKLLVINFEKDKMVLRVPKGRAEKAGLRHLSSTSDFQKAIEALRGKARIAKGMWSKRAQEYEAKINSGDVKNIAEVLRDLHENVDDPDRSYSEKMIYESAFERFTNEYSIAKSLDKETAILEITEMLEEVKMRDAA